MPLSIAELTMVVIVSLFGARVGSDLIDGFYRREPETLSYPESWPERSRPRQAVLAVGLVAYVWLLVLIANSLPPRDGLIFLAGRMILGWGLLITICTDFEQQVIFDRFLLPLSVCALCFGLIAQVSWPTHLLSALGGGGVFLLLAIITKGGIGGGDIKLMAMLGLWCGERIVPIAVLGLILAGVIAFLLLITGQKKRREFFAYGPYFALSAMYIMASP